MSGDERIQDRMFSCVSLQQRATSDHPLRRLRKLTDWVLQGLSPRFDALHADSDRLSIAPQYILRALPLQVFYPASYERLIRPAKVNFIRFMEKRRSRRLRLRPLTYRTQ